MTGPQPPDRGAKPCRSCGRELSAATQTCPHCGEVQAQQECLARGDGLGPLGGGPVTTSPRTPHPRAVAPVRPPSAGPTRTGRSGAAEPPRRPEVSGFLEYAKEQIRSDPWFALLMAALALGGLHAFVTGQFFVAVIACIVFWGLLTFQYWIYIIVVILCGLSVVGGAISLLTAGPASFSDLLTLAWQIIVLAVLLNRSDLYT